MQEPEKGNTFVVVVSKRSPLCDDRMWWLLVLPPLLLPCSSESSGALDQAARRCSDRQRPSRWTIRAKWRMLLASRDVLIAANRRSKDSFRFRVRRSRRSSSACCKPGSPPAGIRPTRIERRIDGRLI